MNDTIKNPYFKPPTLSGLEAQGTTQAPAPQQVQPQVPVQLPEIDAKDMPPFVRSKQTGDKVFFVENGNLHWVKSPETLTALGGSFGVVKVINYKSLRKLQNAEPVDMGNVEKYGQAVPKVEEAKPEAPKPEEKPATKPLQTFKKDLPDGAVLEGQGVASAPKSEPEKGFTSIIIPAHLIDYALFHHTGNCIGSIREHTDKGKMPYEIILVLNGKTHVEFNKLEDTKANKVIVNEENKGFSFAVNQGIRCARGEYIAIINNDAQVYDHWLPDMQEALQHLSLVMATPMYGKPYARAVESLELREQVLNKPIQETFNDFRDFSCVLTRKKMFDQIGLFNEKFFVYKEDLDLFNRMDKAGLKYASTKRVNTFHIIGATSHLMGPEELRKEEGGKVYKELWNK